MKLALLGDNLPISTSSRVPVLNGFTSNLPGVAFVTHTVLPEPA